MASAEDMSVLLERIGGMERALLDPQARAEQVTAAPQAMQQQSAATAQRAQRRVAAARTAASVRQLSLTQGYWARLWRSIGETQVGGRSSSRL